MGTILGGAPIPPNFLSLLIQITGGSRHSHWRGPAEASAKNTKQISESGGMPPGKFFLHILQKVANWAFSFIFVRL